MKKPVIVVDKRVFGVYNFEISEREKIIINWLKRQMRSKGQMPDS